MQPFARPAATNEYRSVALLAEPQTHGDHRDPANFFSLRSVTPVNCMKILSGEDEHEYVLEFSDAQEFENFFDRADQEGSFSIEHNGINNASSFRATAIGSLRSRRIKPVKIVKEATSFRIILTEKPGSALPEPTPVETPEEEKREPAKTVAEQIRELGVSEKAMLAMRANLAERRVLMQDMNPKIQEFLLRNPRLTESEIAWLAKNPMSSIPTLLTIIQHKGWMSTDAVRQGILTNPKTPAHILLDKIPTLSAADLIKMHHARNLREDIRYAVDRQIKKRNIRIRPSSD